MVDAGVLDFSELVRSCTRVPRRDLAVQTAKARGARRAS
jgi:hypothetical protein